MASFADYLHPVRKAWSTLWDALFDPKLDDGELDELIRKARETQPLPVIWLLGKTQSGKTAIVRAMTGSTAAEVGNGYRPCTRTSQFYDFPMEAPLARFLDTRGLEEVNYDPTEDLAYCGKQSHMVIAVARAMEPPSASLLTTLSEIREQQPDRPIVVAQTCLHEAYPLKGKHVQPYPFHGAQWPDTVPPKLRRGLAYQRSEFEKHLDPATLTFVPLDFTSDDHSLEPRDYGLDQLWEAVEHQIPRGLRQLLSGNSAITDATSRAADIHIRGYSIAATAVGALPLVGLPGVLTLQAKMLHSVSAIYGEAFDTQLAGEFMTALGTGIGLGFGAKMVGRELIKLVPGWGQSVGAVWAGAASGATTFALGQAASYYLRTLRGGGRIDEKALRRVYRESFARARAFTRTSPGASKA